MPPFSVSVSNTRSPSGETFTAPEVAGACFQLLSPRIVKMYLNAAPETTKSGVSPPPPSRFSGNAEPSAVMRATRSRATCDCAADGASFSAPSVASTSEGAVIASLPGANATSPNFSTHSVAASSVSNGSPA